MNMPTIPAEPRVGTFSVPPNATWPMVAYKFMSELPSLAAILGGIAIALFLIARIPSAYVGGLVAGLTPAIAQYLYRGRPPGHE